MTTSTRRKPVPQAPFSHGTDSAPEATEEVSPETTPEATPEATDTKTVTRNRQTTLLMDYSDLAVTEIEPEEAKKKSTVDLLDGTPFRALVAKSFESKKGLEFPVPAAAVAQVIMLLRKAAAEKEWGINVNPATSKSAVVGDDGKVMIKLAVGEMRKYDRKGKSDKSE